MAIPLHGRLIFGKDLYTQQGLVSILLFILLALPIDSRAQFTKLLDFGNVDNGSYPHSTLLSDGTFLYGMTSDGGTNHFGTIFKVKPDGTNFTKIHDFDETNGSDPYGSLVSDGTFLYGMTSGGGLNSQGILFKIKSDGTGFANLLDFNYTTKGGFPYGSLLYDGTFLYGMTSQGGSNSSGTIFKIMPNGTGFVKLFEFDHATSGGNPRGSLFSDGTFLYGMTTYGGPTDSGTIFKIMPDGTGFVKLLDFDGSSTGGNPLGDFISDGTFLYGMTFYGGNNFGTLFKIKPDGTSFSRVFDFNNSSSGSYPKGTLVYDGTFLYGTTSQGGTNFSGTLFKIKPDGSSFTKLMDSVEGSGGFSPEGTLILNGTSLIATKPSGGSSGLGRIYKINTDGTNYSSLFSFEVSGNSPTGSLISDGTFLYGMTARGGAYNQGTIFKIKSDGTGFVRLFNFNGTLSGGIPHGSLFSDGTFFYGMTSQGGANDVGTMFKIKIDGTGFSKLLDLEYPTVGANASGSLISDGTFLYGVNSGGGSNGYGVYYKIKPDGTEFTKLLDFDDTANGANPNGPLISDGTFLYGTTNGGGTNGYGTIFKVKMDGTGFVKLQDMDYPTGGILYGSLVSDGTFLFGMTSSGGLNDSGTVFKIKSDGTGFTTMLDFDHDITGGSPYGSLILDGTHLYGITSTGSIVHEGTLFKIKTDGTDYAKLLDFNDGVNARGSLLSDGTFLYGMTSQGGVNSLGTLFKRSLAPATVITNFIPAEGVEGTTVVINGVDFDPTPANNIVKFNGTTALVKSSTASTLTVVVPVGTTTGPISVAANSTNTSITDFDVTTEAVMINGSVQNCNVSFEPPSYQYLHDNNYEVTETFSPINPSDKVKVSFTSVNLHSDALYVYDGPTSAAPLIAALDETNSSIDITATGPGGELTFVYEWGDGSTAWNATITCVTGGNAIAPIITSTPLTTSVTGKITLDLVPLINAPGTLDINSIQIVVQPASGAIAEINNGILSIDYAGKVFKGNETITIKACDLSSLCAEQTFSIEVLGEIIIYNAISPNTDGLNEIFRIENIDLLADTKENTVTIYNRWGSKVFEVENYNNNDRVFKGLNDNGNELPSGTYFYKIVFPATGGKRNGYLEIKR